ncbi:MAG: hypothetical protein MR022_05510 [Ruminococcus sp.]|nr:hypothetical protein [Ruminococcus sp.]
MEDFKKKIKFRFQLCTMYCCSGSVLFIVLNRLFDNISDFSRGMLSGMMVAIDMLALFLMVKYLVLLRNEDKLKAEYIKSTDERNITISKETMRTASVISLMLTAIAILVSGFFSKVVAITLFAELTVSTLITVIVNAYYKKKM